MRPYVTIVLTLLLVPTAAAGISAFSIERGELIRSRVSHAFKCRGALGMERELSVPLGLSRPSVRRILWHQPHRLSVNHARTLADLSGRSVEYFLAMDLLDKFNSVDKFDAAVIGDDHITRAQLTTLLVRRLELRHPPAARRPATVWRPDFMTEWRFTIQDRLRHLVRRSARLEEPPRFYISKIALILGKSLPSMTYVLRGPQFISYEDATNLGRIFGVPADWILATDVVGRFANLDALEAALSGQTQPLRNLMMRLYGRHHWGAGGTANLGKTVRSEGS